MSDVTDDNRRSPTREEIDEAKRMIESLTIELIDTRTNLEAAENREEALIREVDNVTTQLKVAELQNERMLRQLKEKKNRNYTEADMDNQFIAGVNALRKYYTEVDISISGNWTPVLKAMELMKAYKNAFQDESVEVESTVRGPARRRQRIE